MITCSDFIARIGDYLEGGVALQVRQRLEEHLSHCQTCTVLVDSSRKTLKVVSDAGSFDLPEAAFRPITAGIMARIRKDQERSG